MNKEHAYTSARYLPLGDSALVVEFGNTINLEINKKVILLDYAITGAAIIGVKETVPTYRSLLVRYDPMKTDYEELASQLRKLEEKITKQDLATSGAKIEIPVVYGGEYGPDIKYVAEYHGITEQQVIDAHSKREYNVYMIGFIAGFPYLGEVADEIATPRLETPRLKVPAGSVGIAEKQTGIYPREAPGGWRIIGRTPLVLFDPSLQPPALLKPGDTVKFKPIMEEKFGNMKDSLVGSNLQS